METKICPRCEEEKPLTNEYWYNDKSTPSGFQSYCKDCNRAHSAAYREKYPERHLLYSTKVRAKKADLPFELTEDDIKTPTHCPILGIRLVRGRGSGNNSPSLDRLVPSKGYTPENVRVISQKANRLKQNATLEELEAVTAWLRQELAA